MKRAVSILICLIYFVASFSFRVAAEPTVEPTAEPLPDPFAEYSTPYLVLMEAETGAVLYERSGYEKAFPASTTKLMTTVLAVENLEDLNRVVTIGWRSVSGFGPKSSLMGLEAYEEISLIDVLYGLMMRSGNDAAKCIAIETAFEVYGDSINEEQAIPSFVDMMNAKAAELGMTSTHFSTVDGRHDPEHYTSAYDFALLMQYALKNPKVCEIISTRVHDIEPTNKHPQGYHLENSNKLICKKETDANSFIYPYCIGGKTGETNDAGYCLISAARKDDVTLILVQFGDDNRTISTTYRYQLAPVMYEWGFKNFKTEPVANFDIQTEFTIQSSGYSPIDEMLGKFTAVADISSLTVSGTADFLDSRRENPELINVVVNAQGAEAPIKKGEIVGTVEYYFYEKKPIVVDLCADRDIAAANKNSQGHSDIVFSPITPPPGSGKNTNLHLGRNPGGEEYSVWVYYDHSLYTMSSKDWHYLYCGDGVFRAATSPELAGEIKLYERLFDSSGNVYYQLTDNCGNGGNFVITAGDYALSSQKMDGTLSAVEVNVDGNGVITSDVNEQMVWKFEHESNGYRISQDSRFLTRKPGSGILFWIIVVVLVLVVLILMRAIDVRRSFRKKGRGRRMYRSGRRR